MQRVFLPATSFSGNGIALPEDAAHYLKTVLRLRPGAEFIALAQGGREYRVRLTGLFPPTAEILEQLPERPAPRLNLTLYQGLPRGKRFPLILQKATELGVARLVAVTTARSQVRLDRREVPRKLEHWGRITTEAAEQCLRSTPPELTMAASWEEALADWRARGIPGLLPDETLAGETARGLRAALEQLGRPPALAVFIGPEGGFSPAETQAGRAAGLVPLALGARILRTETAALVTCALLMYEYGELG